ncbi:MAG TPA: stage II sporulation protein M [Terriglobales bacterium]|nr:stage II sporulation protein M [Terriglobales bacterium]
MILDLDRFARTGQPAWSELEALLERLEARADRRLEAGEAEALEDLYHRAAADLNRLEQGACAGTLRDYLQDLVVRAYREIYAAPRGLPWQGGRWRRLPRAAAGFGRRVPQVFRQHLRWFGLAVGLTLAGCLFGGLAVLFDPAVATHVLLPAEYLRHPAQRVAQDLGQAKGAGGRGPNLSEETVFSAELITHNIQVSLLTLALGVTLGIGTGLLLFENGVLLGAVAARYSQQGFGWFVAGWLLPHGAFEIPSVLIAGQAGFLLAGMMLRGGREPRWVRMRRQLPELLTLLGGLSCLLVWAGTMEAFFSQHHAVGGYGAQVAVGLSEMLLLAAYLSLAGRGGARR